MMRAPTTMPAPVVAIAESAMASAITLAQPPPPRPCATETSGAALAWRFFGEMTPCKPTWASV